MEREVAELPMVDVFLPMMKSAALVSAGQLGLFEALSAGPRTAGSLAQTLGASESGVTRLGDLLVAMGYLEGTCAGYRNSAHAERWFTSRGEVDYSAGLRWTGHAWELMGQLTQTVRRGAPEKLLWERMKESPEWGPAFSQYMRAFAGHLSPDLLAQVRLPEGATRLLDLGGSHGLHSIGFCRRYPALSAVLVDLPSALSDTAELLRREQLSDRIQLRPGDIRTLEWGDGFDLVLYLSVAHNQSAQDNQKLLARAAGALRPGGRLVIHEYLADLPLDSYGAAFRVTLLVETGTRTYSSEELRLWLHQAGFASVRRVDLSPREKGSLLIAERR
jgi:SAM-dependent methyltransferase